MDRGGGGGGGEGCSATVAEENGVRGQHGRCADTQSTGQRRAHDFTPSSGRYVRLRSAYTKSTYTNYSVLPQVIRGNSVVMLEALERIGGDERPGRG